MKDYKNYSKNNHSYKHK